MNDGQGVFDVSSSSEASCEYEEEDDNNEEVEEVDEEEEDASAPLHAPTTLRRRKRCLRGACPALAAPHSSDRCASAQLSTHSPPQLAAQPGRPARVFSLTASSARWQRAQAVNR